MTQAQIISVYFMTLIVSGVVIALNAFICYLRTRQVAALKYFSRQQLGTVVAHVAQVIALVMLMLSTSGNTQLAELSVVLTLPAEILKAVVWSTLMLSLVGIINGIKRAPAPIGQSAQDAGHAAAFINQVSHAAVTMPYPPLVDGLPIQVEVVNHTPLPVEIVPPPTGIPVEVVSPLPMPMTAAERAAIAAEAQQTAQTSDPGNP